MSTVHETAYPVLPAEVDDDELRKVYTPSAAEFHFVCGQFQQASSTTCIGCHESSRGCRRSAVQSTPTCSRRPRHTAGTTSIGSGPICSTSSERYRRSIQRSTLISLSNQPLKAILAESLRIPADPQRGWQFTLREIARRANVSHSAPYRHFPDKASRLHELALIGFDRLCEELEAVTKHVDSVPVQLRKLAYAHLGFGERSPDLYRLMFNTDAGEPIDIHTDLRIAGTLSSRGQGPRAGAARRFDSPPARAWSGNSLLGAFARTDHASNRRTTGAGKSERQRF